MKSNVNSAVYLRSQRMSRRNEEETSDKPECRADGIIVREANSALQNFAESSSKVNLGKSPYTEYLQSGSNYFTLVIFVLVFALNQAAANSADYWMSYWTKKEEMKFSGRYQYSLSPNVGVNYSENGSLFHDLDVEPFHDEWTSSREFCILVYSVIIAALLVLSFIKLFVFYNACEACSNEIHNQVMNSVIRTHVIFFDINPSGRVLNRFTSDMGAIDEGIPRTVMDGLHLMFQSIGLLVMACVVNSWLLIVAFPLAGVVYLIVRLYLRTSINLMRVESISRSPVFVHVNATIQGLPTIRALNAQAVIKKEFDQHQDLYTSATYALNVISKTQSLYIDCACFIFIASAVFSFLIMDTDSYAGNVGLAVTLSFGLIIWLQHSIVQFSAVAENMTSVERVLEYKYLEEEKNLDTTPYNAAPPHWPDNGCIEFINTSLKYMDNGPSVLKEVNFLINPCEKVGIVGRTGAGKSSLIMALFRLAEVEGSILIDGIDTRDISLHDLRKKISIIPQDPFLFSGTLRENLDRFNEFHDHELLSALEDVDMKKMLNDTDGLNMKVTDKGDNFSVGQKQLLCLARAILRNNKILVLDEATANVDLKTDELIQRTLKTKFTRCTVLTVAHRLNTIMDCDKIMVMNEGRLEEFGHPHLLLKNTDGMFYKMVQKTGQLNSLAGVALKNYAHLKKIQT